MFLPQQIPPFVAIDTETTGLHPWKGDRPFAAAAVFDNGLEKVWRDDFTGLGEILADPGYDKVFHNAKFDWRMLRYKGFEIKGRVWDTSIFCHLLDGRDAAGGLNLDDCAKKYLPADFRKVTTEIDDWFNANGYEKVKPKKRKGMFQLLPNEILFKRVIGDARLCGMLFKRMYMTVMRTFPFLLEMEHRLIPILLRMEDRGVLVSYEEIVKQMDHFEVLLDDVRVFCEGVLDFDWFNINSPIHQKALLEEAGILHLITEFTKPKKNRKSKKPFIPQPKLSAMNLLQLHHPVAHMLLLGKAAGKMISPFLTQARDLSVVCEDNEDFGILHPSFKQTGTTSGRFSCAEPNLQNIPVEGDRRAMFTEADAIEAVEMTGHNFAPHIKRLFHVRPGYCNIHSDKKQAEMAALAHYTRDPQMIKAFTENLSIHDEICKLLFGELTKGLKQRAKMATFGYQYGCGLMTLAKSIRGTIQEARSLKMRYEHIFPSLPRWIAELNAIVEAQGYVQTDHGRRHYLYKNQSYMAVNRICQGTIGDEVKSRMVVIGEELLSEGVDGQILLNIHDDINTELALYERDKWVPRIYEMMRETSIPYNLPLPSSLDITYTRWADLEPIEYPYDPSTYPKPRPIPQDSPTSVPAETIAAFN
jgi:DNA polymerase-1